MSDLERLRNYVQDRREIAARMVDTGSTSQRIHAAHRLDELELILMQINKLNMENTDV